MAFAFQNFFGSEGVELKKRSDAALKSYGSVEDVRAWLVIAFRFSL